MISLPKPRQSVQRVCGSRLRREMLCVDHNQHAPVLQAVSQDTQIRVTSLPNIGLRPHPRPQAVGQQQLSRRRFWKVLVEVLTPQADVWQQGECALGRWCASVGASETPQYLT